MELKRFGPWMDGSATWQFGPRDEGAYCLYADAKATVAALHSALERVTRERDEASAIAADYKDGLAREQQAHINTATDLASRYNAVLTERDKYLALILALPKVRGEIIYECLTLISDDALTALLRERQGMP